MSGPHDYSYVSVSALKKTGPGVLHVAIIAPAAAIASMIVYDGLTATGSIMFRIRGAANGGSQEMDAHGGIVFNTGLYVAIGGAGGTGLVVFD